MNIFLLQPTSQKLGRVLKYIIESTLNISFSQSKTSIHENPQFYPLILHLKLVYSLVFQEKITKK